MRLQSIRTFFLQEGICLQTTALPLTRQNDRLLSLDMRLKVANFLNLKESELPF